MTVLLITISIPVFLQRVVEIWHVARSITKKLLKASKEKGCEITAHWIRGIRKHLYWCATSTKQGFGALIVVKWNSFMRHVANKDKDHRSSVQRM